MLESEAQFAKVDAEQADLADRITSVGEVSSRMLRRELQVLVSRTPRPASHVISSRA